MLSPRPYDGGGFAWTPEDQAALDREMRPRPRGRVYLAGPITGYDVDERIATFRSRAALLAQDGYEVVNPCELSPPGLDWHLSLRTDIREMMSCDTIFLQKGWEKSKGVRLELHIALALDFKVIVEGETA